MQDDAKRAAVDHEALHRLAAARRREIQEKARAMGVDEAFVSQLVERFYARIRADARLGPIFEKAIGEDWGPHLARMKDFWASVAWSAGRYSGRPVPAHLKLKGGLAPEDFGRWLGLFRETLDELTDHPEVAPYFMARAERIAASLAMALFERPGEAPSLRPLG